MFFKNLSLYRFADGAVDHAKLGAALTKHQLRPIGAVELKCSGFVNCGMADSLLVTLGDYGICRLAVTEKVLPPAVINEELAKRVALIQDEDGKRVGAKERKRIKDEILTDFMARAFSQTRASSAYFDFKNGWLVIDTATRKVAEFFITSLRNALGSFPCTPLTPEESPKVLMTDWLARGALPDKFLLGDECNLSESAEAGAAWAGKRTDLETDEVREHLKSGMQVERLGLTFDDRLSFVLDVELGVRKLKFLDIVAGQVRGDDAEAEALSSFTLMTLELGRLLETLTEVFQVPRAAALALDGGAVAPEMRRKRRAAAQDDVLARASDEQLDGALQRDPGLYAVVKDLKRKRSQANLERATKLTAKMYAARDSMRTLLGAKYAETMREFGKQLKAFAKKERLDLLKAAIELAKQPGHPEAWGAMVISAYVESIEPSAPIENSRNKEMEQELNKALKKRGLNGHVTVGAPIGDKLNALDPASLSADELKWLRGGERGASSDTMFAALRGVESIDHFHPLDPADLRRCRLLLEAVPDYAHRLGELAHLSPVWERLVTAWPDLCSTFDAECPDWRNGKGSAPQTYEAMKFYIGRPE